MARQRSLSPEERTKLAHAVGAYGDAEQAQGRPIHPRHWWWPPRGMADGLYKDVVEDRAMWFCFFHACSSVRWALVVSHILVSATIAALGQGSSDGASGRKVSHMTALAAANAVIAGLLALLHNSGLPDRYRNNKAEFEMVEDHIRRLLDSGLAPEDQTIGQVICDCFDRFADAKAAVMASLPATYNSKRRLRPQPLYLGSQPSVGL